MVIYSLVSRSLSSFSYIINQYRKLLQQSKRKFVQKKNSIFFFLSSLLLSPFQSHLDSFIFFSLDILITLFYYTNVIDWLIIIYYLYICLSLVISLSLFLNMCVCVSVNNSVFNLNQPWECEVNQIKASDEKEDEVKNRKENIFSSVEFIVLLWVCRFAMENVAILFKADE